MGTIISAGTVITRFKMKLETKHLCTVSKQYSKSTHPLSKTSPDYTRERVSLLCVCASMLRGTVGKAERKVNKYTSNTKHIFNTLLQEKI